MALCNHLALIASWNGVCGDKYRKKHQEPLVRQASAPHFMMTIILLGPIPCSETMEVTIAGSPEPQEQPIQAVLFTEVSSVLLLAMILKRQTL